MISKDSSSPIWIVAAKIFFFFLTDIVWLLRPIMLDPSVIYTKYHLRNTRVAISTAQHLLQSKNYVKPGSNAAKLRCAAPRKNHMWVFFLPYKWNSYTTSGIWANHCVQCCATGIYICAQAEWVHTLLIQCFVAWTLNFDPEVQNISRQLSAACHSDPHNA